MALSEMGRFIHERMDEVGIETVKELSRKSGVSISGLTRTLHNDQMMQTKTAERLARVLKCDPQELRDIAPDSPTVRRRNSIPPNFKKRQSICWKCANAVPDAAHGLGCNWSREFAPVEGWEAVETQSVRYDGGHRRHIRSALVLDCPQYLADMEVVR